MCDNWVEIPRTSAKNDSANHIRENIDILIAGPGIGVLAYKKI
jgi:hypothetical protein